MNGWKNNIKKELGKAKLGGMNSNKPD